LDDESIVTHTCIEIPHKPSIEDVHMTLRAVAAALKDLGCDFTEGASWVIARCPGSLVEASVIRPRHILEAPPRLSAVIRISGSLEGVYKTSSHVMKALRELGIPLELTPGCLRLE
jgi:hypothetical protein